MANYKTGAQRYNDRMDKIWAKARTTEPEWINESKHMKKKYNFIGLSGKTISPENAHSDERRPKGYWSKGVQNYDTGKMNKSKHKALEKKKGKLTVKELEASMKIARGKAGKNLPRVEKLQKQYMKSFKSC